jgi:hypothetical protein
MDEAARETVIVVHGTYAAPLLGASLWYQPVEGVPATGGFIAKLNDALQKRGSAARCWAHCSQRDQGFHWSGKNNWIDRTDAASKLGNYVCSLRNEGWRCHIVAHSHGGNVVLEALPQITTALSSNAPLGKIVTLGTPFMKGDWDAWNARSLAAEPIVRLILDGTVVRVRLDRKATAISLLVVIGVRQDGQKILLATTPIAQPIDLAA